MKIPTMTPPVGVPTCEEGMKGTAMLYSSTNMMGTNMMGGMGAMMWGMGFVGLLVVAVLILAAAALAKYVFFDGGHSR